MKPLPFAWPYWIPFWLVYVWAFLPEFLIIHRASKGASQPDSPDAGSMRILMLGQSLGLVSAFILAFLPYGRVPANLQHFFFWFGVAMIVWGSLLRRHCWKLLGESFTGNVQVEPGQAIINHGAYAWVRHPSYTGGLLLLVGISVALGSWAGMLATATATFFSYQYRMSVEERALESTLGEPYREFMRTRKRIIPFVY